MRRKVILGGTALACAAMASSVALAAGSGGGGSSAPSRLDDGNDLLSQANITEQQAIQAAQGAASGDLNEVDLEHYGGRLVYNVDVGSHDVKVDAATGDVVASSADD